MGKLVGTRELARKFDVSPSAVTRAVQEGRITPATKVNGRAMFDIETARTQWLNNTAPHDATGMPGIPASNQVEKQATSVGGDIARFNAARADAAELQVEQERMKLAALRKTLLPADEIKLAWTQYIRDASQALSGLAQKTFSRYPGLKAQGRDFIHKEVRRILDDLGQWKPGES